MEPHESDRYAAVPLLPHLQFSPVPLFAILHFALPQATQQKSQQLSALFLGWNPSAASDMHVSPSQFEPQTCGPSSLPLAVAEGDRQLLYRDEPPTAYFRSSTCFLM